MEKKILATAVSYSHTNEIREMFLDKKLKESYFTNPFYQEVFKIIDTLYSKQLIPTIESISMNRGEMYKSSFIKDEDEMTTYYSFKLDLVLLSGFFVSIVELQTNILLLKEFVIMDYWNNVSSNILEAHWMSRDVLIVSDNIIGGYNELMNELSSNSMKIDVNGDVKSIVEQARKKHEAFIKGIDNTVKLGHEKLDDHVGGFTDSELIVIGGRPGMGKTALALGIAKFNSFDLSKKTKKGIYFSLEMTKEQLMMKYASPVLNIPYSKLKAYRISEEEFNKLMNYFLYFESKIPLNIVFENRLEVIIDIALKEKPDYIIVDYLQLVKTAKNTQSREQEVAHISKSLKELSVQCSCPVFALSQLKRKDGKPALTDLRESGSLEQDADAVIFPYRPSYNDDAASQYEPGNLEIMMPKCRSSGPGYFTGYFDLIDFKLYNERVITLADYKRITNKV